MSINGINYSITNVDINNNEENAYTLQKATELNINKIFNKKVIITWSDILMIDDIDLLKLNENKIFTYGKESRYYSERNILYKKKEGNVIGCFYIDNMKQLMNDNIKNDFCDIFEQNFGKFDIYELENMSDVGDMIKFDKFLEDKKLKYNTRYFNYIEELNNQTLKKKYTDDYGKKILENEIKFYKYISIYDLNFPEIYSYGNDYFIMQNLTEFKNVYKIPLSEIIIISIFNSLKKIHDTKIQKIKKCYFDLDIKLEFYDKLITRVDEISSIANYIKPCSINGVFIIENNINNIINNLFSKIYEKIKNKNEYNLIHGDCSFSNTLYNVENNKIYFIDPRGYFGNTSFFGLKEYDYSKILYSLSGYDNFNNDEKYYFTYENNNIETRINLNNLLKYKYIFEENDIDFELCLYMVIVHWVGLSSYNKNNLHKCIASYYQGIFLYNKYIL